MSDLIQAWKKNLKSYEYLSEVEKEFVGNTDNNNLIYLDVFKGKWTPVGRMGSDCRSDIIYRLRPDYAEKPSVVECEVYVDGEDNCVCYRKNHGESTPLSCAVDDPNHIGYRYKGGLELPYLGLRKDIRGLIFKSTYVTGSLYDYELIPLTHVLFKGATK